MTRKSRREARQDSKRARSMEKKLLRGAFKQELNGLRFEDLSFNGRLMEDLADKECLGLVIGINLGLSEKEVQGLITVHEESIAYSSKLKNDSTLALGLRKTDSNYAFPTLDMDPLIK